MKNIFNFMLDMVVTLCIVVLVITGMALMWGVGITIVNVFLPWLWEKTESITTQQWSKWRRRWLGGTTTTRNNNNDDSYSENAISMQRINTKNGNSSSSGGTGSNSNNNDMQNILLD